jgi:hypothetical protein
MAQKQISEFDEVLDETFRRMEVARKALKQIKAYVAGHEEPGHECIQCLVEHEVDTALEQMGRE